MRGESNRWKIPIKGFLKINRNIERFQLPICDQPIVESYHASDVPLLGTSH